MLLQISEDVLWSSRITVLRAKELFQGFDGIEQIVFQGGQRYKQKT